ncbi:hypothetical protein PENTCL1PPCAC_21726, partial [Pristionchus entomophagus]
SNLFVRGKSEFLLISLLFALHFDVEEQCSIVTHDLKRFIQSLRHFYRKSVLARIAINSFPIVEHLQLDHILADSLQ